MKKPVGVQQRREERPAHWDEKDAGKCAEEEERSETEGLGDFRNRNNIETSLKQYFRMRKDGEQKC